MATTIDTVLFDFDGTLAETLPLTYRGLRAVFTLYEGVVLTDDEIKAMFGPTEKGIIRTRLTDKEKVEEAIAEYFRIYLTEHETLVPQTEETRRLLQSLKERGCKIGVVTGKSRESFDYTVQKLGLKPYLDVTITGDDVRKEKPDPEGILKALDALGKGRDQAVFIGDSDADIKAGKAAGVRTIGVRWLPTVQTAEFSVKPDAEFTRVSDFTIT